MIVGWYRYCLRFVDLMLIVLVCLSGCYELYWYLLGGLILVAGFWFIDLRVLWLV